MAYLCDLTTSFDPIASIWYNLLIILNDFIPCSFRRIISLYFSSNFYSEKSSNLWIGWSFLSSFSDRAHFFKIYSFRRLILEYCVLVAPFWMPIMICIDLFASMSLLASFKFLILTSLSFWLHLLLKTEFYRCIYSLKSLCKLMSCSDRVT